MDLKNDDAQAPIHLAVLTGQPNVVRHLLIAGAKVRRICVIPCDESEKYNDLIEIPSSRNEKKKYSVIELTILGYFKIGESFPRARKSRDVRQ